MDHRLGEALAHAWIGETRLSDRIDHLQTQVDNLSAVLTDHFVRGVELHDERIIKTHEELQSHHRNMHDLRRERRRMSKKARRLEKRASEAELKPIRQAAMRESCLGSDRENLHAGVTARPEQIHHKTGSSRNAKSPNKPLSAGSARLNEILRLESARQVAALYSEESLQQERTSQIRFETKRISQGKQPIDPSHRDTWSSRSRGGLNPDEIVLLQRVITQPELLKYYPHAKEYLENRPTDPTDPIIRDARATLADYPSVVHKMPRMCLSSTQQQVHDAIQDSAQLSDQAKLILLVTTFIPRGRWITYHAIRSWVRSATKGVVPLRNVISALRKAEALFELDEVPIHRVIEKNDGSWGTHMSHMGDEERGNLFGEEEYPLTIDKYIGGSELEIFELVEDMRGTAMERYVKKFP